MKKDDVIVQKAIEIHQRIRNINEKGISNATRQAITITKEWQNYFRDYEHLEAETRVAKDNKEKIDIVDHQQRLAYEMKVSGKNPHHEFYKDLIKIVIYNENNPQKKLHTLVFITKDEGIQSLERRLGLQIKDRFLKSLGIKVVLVSIPKHSIRLR